MPETSREFQDAVCHSGSTGILCQFCGVTYFCREDEDIDDLRRRAEEEPGKYVEVQDWPRWGTLDGKQWVADCGCPRGKQIEDFLWSHRRIISEYLRARSKRELENAQRDSYKVTSALQEASQNEEAKTGVQTG